MSLHFGFNETNVDGLLRERENGREKRFQQFGEKRIVKNLKRLSHGLCSFEWWIKLIPLSVIQPTFSLFCLNYLISHKSISRGSIEQWS